MNSNEENANIPEENEDIVFISEEGDEMPFSILASKEVNGVMYILAADGEEGEALHFKCVPADEDELVLELVDEEHEDYKMVFELFMEDYDALGIDIE